LVGWSAVATSSWDLFIPDEAVEVVVDEVGEEEEEVEVVEVVEGEEDVEEDGEEGFLFLDDGEVGGEEDLDFSLLLGSA
jgi:hypothetical protein